MDLAHVALAIDSNITQTNKPKKTTHTGLTAAGLRVNVRGRACVRVSAVRVGGREGGAACVGGRGHAGGSRCTRTQHW